MGGVSKKRGGGGVGGGGRARGTPGRESWIAVWPRRRVWTTHPSRLRRGACAPTAWSQIGRALSHEATCGLNAGGAAAGQSRLPCPEEVGGLVGAPPYVTPPHTPPPLQAAAPRHGRGHRPRGHRCQSIRRRPPPGRVAGRPRRALWGWGAGGRGGASSSASTGQAGRILPHPPRLA